MRLTPQSEVKNEWSYISAPSICLRDVDRDKFTFNCKVEGFQELTSSVKVK
jgi:hypothetical protein